MARNSPATRRLIDALTARGVHITARKIETLRGGRLVPAPPRDRPPTNAELDHYTAAVELTRQGRPTVGTATALARRGHPVGAETVRADVLAFIGAGDCADYPNDPEEREAAHSERAEAEARKLRTDQDPTSALIRELDRTGIAESGLADMTADRSSADVVMLDRIIHSDNDQAATAFTHATDDPEEIARSLTTDRMRVAYGEPPAYPGLAAEVTAGMIRASVRETLGDDVAGDPMMQQVFAEVTNILGDVLAQLDMPRVVEVIRSTPMPDLLTLARRVADGTPRLLSGLPGRSPFTLPAITEQTGAVLSVVGAAVLTTLGEEVIAAALWALSPMPDPAAVPPLPAFPRNTSDARARLWSHSH